MKCSLAVSVIFVPSYLLIFSLIFSQNCHRCAILCTNNLPVLLSCPLTNPQPVVYLQDLFAFSLPFFKKSGTATWTLNPYKIQYTQHVIGLIVELCKGSKVSHCCTLHEVFFQAMSIKLFDWQTNRTQWNLIEQLKFDCRTQSNINQTGKSSKFPLSSIDVLTLSIAFGVQLRSIVLISVRSNRFKTNQDFPVFFDWCSI